MGVDLPWGHFHNNWRNDDFRKLVLNSIVWTAHGEIPDNVIGSTTPTEAELEANQDYPERKPKAKSKG